MHLAVFAGERAVAFQHDRRVVIQPWRAALEQRTDDDDAELLGQCGEKIRRRAGDRLGEIEQLGRFVLAEVQRGMAFLQQHQLRATRTEERRVGKEWVSTFRYRWATEHTK